MRRTVLLAALLVLGVLHAASAEWVRIVHPFSIRILVSPTKKVVEIETWKKKGHMNFVNLSFWDGRGPVGRLVVGSKEYGRGKADWPVFCIDPCIGEHLGGDLVTGFSGSNVLVKEGRETAQKRSFFARRRCPRTGVGVTKDGMIVIIVSTSATMKGFARKFVENGAIFAINVDGGSSTMFVENGESLWNSRRSAVPVILSW